MASQPRVAKTFCTTREAAQILGVSLRTAQLWTESGLLEGWKTGGGHRRITRQSVERLLANPTVRVAETEAGQVTQQRRPSAARNAKRPLNILVVEDEVDLRRVYEIVLSRWSMRPNVVTVADGYAALIRIGLERPDLVVTDLLMPGMNGFQMIHSLRTVAELADTRVVVVTGLDPAEIEDQGGLPADVVVLPKPIPFDELLRIAETLPAGQAGIHLVSRSST